jgi:hypothetical protein
MKKLSYVATAFIVVLSTAPVLAQDEAGSFVAMSDLIVSHEETGLMPLPDTSLDSVEGTGFCIGCPKINLNIVVTPITQLNVINQISVALGRSITQISGVNASNTLGFMGRP